jgi:F-type H+-transporting ATPase subunit a
MDVHVEIAAETLFHIGPIAVTNSMLTMFLVMAGILLVFWFVARSMKEIPGKGQSIVEVIVEFMLSLVEGTAGTKKAARQIFPLIGGLFIFILIANYSGLLPGVGTIGTWRTEHEKAKTTETAQVYQVASTGASSANANTAVAAETETTKKVLVPFLRSPDADINMTLAMALVTFTIVQIAGIRAHGVRGRIKHMAQPAFILPIEIISEFSRIISLSARLFGNVFAGEVLLGVMYAMTNAIKITIIPFFFPVIFIFLELLFGAIQALVFALLTLIYITLATAGGHDDEEAHEAHGVAGHGAPAVASGHAD